MTQIKTFLKLTNSENISHSRLKSLIGGWDNSFLPGKIRTFLFKFYNNILGLNSRVAKFNVDIDPSCAPYKTIGLLKRKPSPTSFSFAIPQII